MTSPTTSDPIAAAIAEAPKRVEALATTGGYYLLARRILTSRAWPSTEELFSLCQHMSRDARALNAQINHAQHSSMPRAHREFY